MNRRIYKIVSLIFSIVLCLNFFVFSVSAAEKTSDLFTIDSVRNMAISITYEKEPPSVKFIAPNGDIYDSNAVTAKKMTVSDSGEALYYKIPNAQAGTWKIVYDKKGNTELNVSYAPYVEALTIDSFSFTKKDNDSLTATFKVSFSESIYFDYHIYAAVAENEIVTGKKLLKTGTTQTNSSVSVSVDLSSLTSYNGYRLLLEVEATSNGLNVFDSLLATQSFNYTNANAPEAPQNFYVELDVSELSLLIDWSNTPADYQETIVSVYFNDEKEPTYYNSFDSDTTATEVAVVDAFTKIRIDVAYKNGYGVLSNTATRNLTSAAANKISLVCDDVTSAAQASVNYDLSGYKNKSFKAILSVNDSEEELVLKGKNSFSVKLEHFNNDVALRWFYNDYTVFKVGAQIYSDRIPPKLTIPDSSDTIKTSNSTYVLAGVVDVGCTLTINNKAVTPDADGIFSEEMKVNLGENIFTIVATGPNGNKTSQTVIVYRSTSSLQQTTENTSPLFEFEALIATIIFSVSFVLFFLFSKRTYRKVSKRKGKTAATLSVIRNFSVLLFFLSLGYSAFSVYKFIQTNNTINSIEFYKVAERSISEAYKMLAVNVSNKTAAIISIVLPVLFLVVIIALSIFVKKATVIQPKDAEVEKKDAKNNKKKKEKKNKKAVSEAKNNDIFCPFCGSPLNPGDTVCNNCNNPL